MPSRPFSFPAEGLFCPGQPPGDLKDQRGSPSLEVGDGIGTPREQAVAEGKILLMPLRPNALRAGHKVPTPELKLVVRKPTLLHGSSSFRFWYPASTGHRVARVVAAETV